MVDLGESLEMVKSGSNNNYMDCYEFAKKYILSSSKPFTCEAVRDSYIGPVPKEPRVWGSVFADLKKEGLIQEAGRTKYKNKIGHSREVRLWEPYSPIPVKQGDIISRLQVLYRVQSIIEGSIFAVNLLSGNMVSMKYEPTMKIYREI